MELWRISNHRSLSGEGGLRYAARWHSAGQPIVYLAESPAGAMVEVLVHLELEEDELPPSYTLLRVVVPDNLAVEEIRIPEKELWKSNLATSRKLGDDWLLHAETALARVPSAILPDTFNYLLNPLHADAKRVKVASATRAIFDPRLLQHLRSG
ncbi:MAG TPA: RES family NAD+ phosphorylase [Edaphobacter sp.]|nr:RES family NAD+ phosphorylase [Edaphobacter sp.]